MGILVSLVSREEKGVLPSGPGKRVKCLSTDVKPGKCQVQEETDPVPARVPFSYPMDTLWGTNPESGQVGRGAPAPELAATFPEGQDLLGPRDCTVLSTSNRGLPRSSSKDLIVPGH